MKTDKKEIYKRRTNTKLSEKAQLEQYNKAELEVASWKDKKPEVSLTTSCV